MVEKGERPPRPEGIHFCPEIPLDDLWSLVEACWAQFPDQRPTGREVQIAIERFQRVYAADPLETNGQPSPKTGARNNAGRKHTCQYCDEAFGSKSRLYDHVTLHHVKPRE
jgi:hypothetical protein